MIKTVLFIAILFIVSCAKDKGHEPKPDNSDWCGTKTTGHKLTQPSGKTQIRGIKK